MSEPRGLTFPKRTDAATPGPGSWVAKRRLGLTADRTRVVDYYSVEAAFLFRPEGKLVTAAESEQYRIGPDQDTTPPDQADSATPAAEVKEATLLDDKARSKPEDKAMTRSSRRTK